MRKLTFAAAFAVLLSSLVALADIAKHAHLQQAQTSVNAAMTALKAAKVKGEYGGHRKSAEDALNTALQEIQAASDFADGHH